MSYTNLFHNKNIIFITSNDFTTISGGGSQCTNRNYLSLCEILGSSNVKVVQLVTRLDIRFSSIASRAMNYIMGRDAELVKKNYNQSR